MNRSLRFRLILLFIFLLPVQDVPAQKNRPKDAAIKQYNRGIELISQGRLQEAIEAYKQAIRISPRFAEAHNNLGNVYGKLGDHRSAVQAYTQAISNDPNFAEAHYYLGIEYGNLDRWPEAVESLKQAVRLKPGLIDARFRLGISHLRVGDKTSAMAEYELLKALDENLGRELFNLINK
jgi:tetratricopeptide (TPR) repeat protein